MLTSIHIAAVSAVAGFDSAAAARVERCAANVSSERSMTPDDRADAEAVKMDLDCDSDCDCDCDCGAKRINASDRVDDKAALAEEAEAAATAAAPSDGNSKRGSAGGSWYEGEENEKAETAGTVEEEDMARSCVAGSPDDRDEDADADSEVAGGALEPAARTGGVRTAAANDDDDDDDESGQDSAVAALKEPPAAPTRIACCSDAANDAGAAFAVEVEVGVAA